METVSKPIEYIDHIDTAFLFRENMYHASGESKYFVSNYRKALMNRANVFRPRGVALLYAQRGRDPRKRALYLARNGTISGLKGTEQDPIRHLRFQNLRFEVAGYRTPRMGESPQAAQH